MLQYNRPTSLSPRVWRQHGRFRIEDMTDNRIPEAVDHMVEFFLRDDPLCRSGGIAEDPVSVEEVRGFWHDTLQQNVSLVAIDETTNRIAGMNALRISTKSPTHEALVFHGEPMKKVFDLFLHCSTLVDVFDKFQTDLVMDALGLSVAKQYRKQGLGLEILRARFDLGRALGIKITETVFTNINSQNLAFKAGFEVLAALPYKEYVVDGEVVFKNMDPHKNIMQMAAVIPP